MTPPEKQAVFCTKDTGYRGIWHGQTPTRDEYAYKYSGGLGTYPHQHRPFAVYRPEVHRTFFVWGGAPVDSWTRPRNESFGEGQLLHMVSYYDHATGRVPRPTILLDKWCSDPHDNPVLSIDEAGHLWVFSPSHGSGTTPSFIHRSVRPYDIDRFEMVEESLYAYPQPWHVPGEGFVLLHTLYQKGRALHVRRSDAEGRRWTEPAPLAKIAQGSYQTSALRPDGRAVGTAFNYHPPVGGLEARTNLYYMESHDLGRTWQTADGRPVPVPLTEPRNPALVHEYEAEGRKVYLKDFTFDGDGRPVILYLTSGGHEPGPKNDPRIWKTARWTGREWVRRDFTRSDNNYDMGQLSIEAPDLWRVIAPTETGAQPFNPGGEVALWLSRDQGLTWKRERMLTQGSRYNHTFVRRPANAHPDFYAFWADGDARRPSASRLYFSNRDGTEVRVLPEQMTADAAVPERV